MRSLPTGLPINGYIPCWISLGDLGQIPLGQLNSYLAYNMLPFNWASVSGLATVNTFLCEVVSVITVTFLAVDVALWCCLALVTLPIISISAACYSDSQVGAVGIAATVVVFTYERDLSYVVQQVCLYMHDPHDPHFTALKRILRYVRATLDYGLQLHVTLYRSSVEAEYRGVVNVVVETAWIRNLICELHTPLFTAILVYCDNVSVVYMSANPVQHQRTKHIEIDIHFVRDFVASGQVRVLHVPSRFHYLGLKPTPFVSINTLYIAENEASKSNSLSMAAHHGLRMNDIRCECRSKFACHLDCFAWVKRYSYLPQGSHGLKAVTKAKLGYDPLEVNPEDMVRFAMEKPQELIENLDRDHLYAIKMEGKMDVESVSNYDEVKNAIMEKLIMLRDEPTREDCPLIYHLDVAAMYPNIILTNRLQPSSIVTDDVCTACDFNRPGKLVFGNWKCLEGVHKFAKISPDALGIDIEDSLVMEAIL
ncbi:ribonuclease H-like domain-containing protein [Tanacetum coccineum]